MRRRQPKRQQIEEHIGRDVLGGMLMLIDPPAECLALPVEPRDAKVEIEYEALGHFFKCVITYEGIA